jgi:hypothetical protein
MNISLLLRLCVVGVYLSALPQAFAQQAAVKDLLQAPKSCLQYAEFRQEKTLNGLPKPLVSKGRILLDCNRGTLWSTRTPISETLVYTFSGKHWLINAEGEVQPIKSTPQKRIGDILARIVRGDHEFIDKYFQREVTGQTTRLLPAQKRLKKYIETITLEETPEGMVVLVARTDKQNMRIDISAVRELQNLDAQSCQNLLETSAGCAQLFSEAGG